MNSLKVGDKNRAENKAAYGGGGAAQGAGLWDESWTVLSLRAERETPARLLRPVGPLLVGLRKGRGDSNQAPLLPMKRASLKAKKSKQIQNK